jgi:hypothetical protein
MAVSDEAKPRADDAEGSQKSEKIDIVVTYDGNRACLARVRTRRAALTAAQARRSR